MLTELIITIAVIVLLPIIFGVVFLARVWEERKMRINESFCIRLPKLITVFFAVFGALFFLGMIGVGFYSVLSYRIVVFTDKVVVKYPFCKPKTFSFEEIAYYSLYGNNFADIQCYDEYGITLGKVYLKPQAAEAAESSNYQSGRSMMFVFYGIGGALILFSVFPGVRFRRYSAAYRAAREAWR